MASLRIAVPHIPGLPTGGRAPCVWGRFGFKRNQTLLRQIGTQAEQEESYQQVCGHPTVDYDDDDDDDDDYNDYDDDDDE